MAGTRNYQSIGEVLVAVKSEFPDITISKIRFLESQGLIAPERTPSGYRKFYEPDVERLRWILRQQRENFLPLKVIRGRLSDDGSDAYGDGGGPGELEDAAEPKADRPGPAPKPAPASALAAKAADAPLELLSAGPTSVSMTIDELATATSLPAHRLAELER